MQWKYSYKKQELAPAFVIPPIFNWVTTLAAIQEVYDKKIASQHIDDAGARIVVKTGKGQVLGQILYGEENDITVHSDRVLAGDKGTKFLLTYQSEKNLKTITLAFLRV